MRSTAVRAVFCAAAKGTNAASGCFGAVAAAVLEPLALVLVTVEDDDDDDDEDDEDEEVGDDAATVGWVRSRPGSATTLPSGNR